MWRDVLRDVLDALEECRDTTKRFRPAHLRQRFELLPGFDHVDALERVRDDGADIPDVEATLLEQIDHALAHERTERLLRFLGRRPRGERLRYEVPEVDARRHVGHFRKIGQSLDGTLCLTPQTERIARAGRPFTGREHPRNRVELVRARNRGPRERAAAKLLARRWRVSFNADRQVVVIDRLPDRFGLPFLAG